MNIIGRDKEIEIVRDHVRRRKSLHIHGPAGTGKSALLEHVYQTWREIGDVPVPLYCKSSGTFRGMLVFLAEILHGRGETLISIDRRRHKKRIERVGDLKAVSSRRIRNMVFPGVKRGDYCVILGANATIVGIVAGFGELVGYALRLVSGFISDKTGKYWTITIIGYLINMGAVPLLALAGRWEIAAVLIIAERMGKAIRRPIF